MAAPRRASRSQSIDLSREQLPVDAIAGAELVAFYLPMHTATRLALPVIDRVRAINPAATICAYGLYAPLNEELLRQHGVTIVLGPEAEEELVRIASSGFSDALAATALQRRLKSSLCQALPRLAFHSARSRRTAVARSLCVAADARWLAARSSARPMRRAAASIAAAIARSCRSTTASSASCRSTSSWRTFARRSSRAPTHITFGDPDFFNGPTHARRIVEALHREFPRRHLRRDHQGRAPARASGAAAACSPRPAACSSRARSSRSTMRCWRSWRRGTRARISSLAAALCREAGADAGADLRRVHAVDDDRRLPRPADGRGRSGPGRRTSRRCSGASGCS